MTNEKGKIMKAFNAIEQDQERRLINAGKICPKCFGPAISLRTDHWNTVFECQRCGTSWAKPRQSEKS